MRSKILALVVTGLVLVWVACSRNGSDGTTPQLVDANPEKGFEYPYLLVTPPEPGSDEGRFLLVEPNNTGQVSDDFQVHLESAKRLTRNAIGGTIARKLNLPLLVPVFPRPETGWTIYTHALDRDVMLLEEGRMRRLDLQLLAMVKDAQERLARSGHPVESEFLLTGFSASGSFANRFTMLHPDRIRAVASGGVNGILMLPLDRLEGVELSYPLGIYDFEELCGEPFDRDAWRGVPQFIYMGAKDENDAVLYDDGYSQAEREAVFSVIGEKMQPDRWEHCQELYRAADAKATFRTYEWMGHGTDGRINAEIVEFFRTAVTTAKSP